MVSLIRSRCRCCAFLFLFFLLFSQELLAPTSEVIKQIAARNLAHFLLLKSLGLQEGPFFLAIDGPPGVGKSSLVGPLTEFIAEAVGNVGRVLRVSRFRQDDFLRSRAARVEEFAPEHGSDGVSGNCDGREFRWPDIRKCIDHVYCGKQYQGFAYKSGKKPDLQPKCFDYSEFDILIFEGTHSTGHELFPYMHATIYLGAEDDLIQFNRLQRECVEGARSWSQCLSMVQVAVSQYPRSIHPNSQRAQYLFELVTDTTLPEVEESQRANWPAVSRSLAVVYSPFSNLVELSQEQQSAMERLQQSNVLSNPHSPIEDTIFAAPAAFWEQLTTLFQSAGFQLSIPARDNSCFFSALARAYEMLGVRNREEAVALLRRLQAQLQTGVLNDVQQQIINDVNAILSLEIEYISHPQHWGGFTTLMYLWAALLGSDKPPTVSIYLMLRLGSKIRILVLNPDGTVSETEELPISGNVLVYDGGTHWMWAEHHDDVVPQNTVEFAHQISSSSSSADDAESGYFSPPFSLSRTSSSSNNLLENSLNFLLIQTMAKILAPSEVTVK